MKTPLGRGLLAVALGLFVVSCSDSGPTQSPVVDRLLPVGNPFQAFNGAGACMEDDNDLFGSGGPVNCDSNDIEIAETFVTSVNGEEFLPTDEILCDPGETLNLGLTLRLVETANSSRQDVGVWVSSDLDSDARFGQCNHYTIDSDAPGVLNEANPDEVDACAGINEGSFFDFPLTGPTIPALCPATGNTITIGGCVAWNVPSDDSKIFCPDPTPNALDPSDGFREASLPTNPAKCNCTPFTISVIIAGQITITKNAIPNHAQDFAYTATGGGMSNFTLDDDLGASGEDVTNAVSKNFDQLNPNVGDPRVITETVPAGWVITNIACTGATNSTVHYLGAAGGTTGYEAGDNQVSINVASGEHVQCTFDNTQQSQITIEKQCVGGTANFDFTGTVPGGGALTPFDRDCAESGVVVAPTTTFGTYTVVEGVETGWTLTGLTCSNGGGNTSTSLGTRTATIGLDAGENVTCTFTNTRQAQITIEKQCVGGTANFDFTGTVPGGGALTPFDRDCAESGVVVAPTTTFGTYTVVEGVETGWTLTGLTCSNGGGNTSTSLGTRTATIGLDAGEQVTCTFTNTLGASITVLKECVGGTANFDFTGTVPGGGALTPFDRDCAEGGLVVSPTTTFGTYTVVEGVETGWELTGLTCSNGGGNTSTSLGTRTATIGLDAGENVTCTFTNTRQAQITIEKQCVGGTANFDFTGTVPGGGALTPFDRDCAESGVVVAPTITFGTYTVVETAETGWTLTGLTCSNGGGNTSTSLGTRTATIGLDAGEQVTCTFTNTRQAQITIEKQCDGGTANFDFTGTVPGGGALTPFDRDCAESGVVVAPTTTFGTYTVVEGVETGWVLTGLACSNGGGNTSTSLGTRTATIGLDAGEQVTCTFTNTKQAKVQVIKTMNAAPITGSETFTFTLRSGATNLLSGTILETIVANSTNGGTLNFTTFLTPGASYQICERVFVGWSSTISSLPGSFVIQPDAEADNSTICVPFTPTAGQTVVINIDNTPPPGGDARTIGFWKNWSSCTGGKQDPVLDQTLASFPIAVGQTTHGVLLGDLYVDTCAEAFAILNKSTLAGKKSASDPAYNMAAQLLAAILNIQAGAGTCTAANEAIADGLALLDAINFNGTGSFKNAAGISGANAIAADLDAYNNNNLCS